MQLKFEKWLSTDPLPPVWRGRRRRTFALLLTSGFAQGLLAVIAGSAMSRLTINDVPSLGIVIFLVVAAVMMGVLRIVETTFAERLGQQYVAETRHIIIEDALGPSRSPNIGITVARATNDLSAVRSWVVSGVSRIVAGVPLLIGVLVSLFILSPAVAGVMVLCLIGFGIYLYNLAPRAYASFREMRRRRGRMASFVADAVRAAPSIHAAGGMERELNNVDKLSEQVEETAVTAAKASGAMAGGASAITMLMMLLTTVAATMSGLKGAELTTVMLLASVLTDPVADFGRITELRQGFNAANYALSRVVERTQTRNEFSSGVTGAQVSTRPTEIHIGSGSAAPFLVAKPGSRVVMRAADRDHLEPILATLLGSSSTAYISFGENHVDLTDDETRRKLIGYASSEHELEQGTLARAIRYRRPNSKEPIEPLLKLLGLSDTVAALPKAKRTKLRRGGEPLNSSERMRVLVARALYETPPVVLFEDISLRSTQQDIEELSRSLADYPGVIIVVDPDDQLLFPKATVWDIDSDEQMVVAKSAIEVTSAATSRPKAETHVAETKAAGRKAQADKPDLAAVSKSAPVVSALGPEAAAPVAADSQAEAAANAAAAAPEAATGSAAAAAAGSRSTRGGAFRAATSQGAEEPQKSVRKPRSPKVVQLTESQRQLALAAAKKIAQDKKAADARRRFETSAPQAGVTRVSPGPAVRSVGVKPAANPANEPSSTPDTPTPANPTPGDQNQLDPQAETVTSEHGRAVKLVSQKRPLSSYGNAVRYSTERKKRA